MIASADDGEERRCTALVDKRITLSEFKREMEHFLTVPAEHLLIYKKTPTTSSTFGTTEREWFQPNETLEMLGDDPHVVVRLGRALLPGEVRCKIHQLKLNDSDGRSKFLFDWVLSSGVRVGQLKKEILTEIKTRFGIEIPPEK